MRRLLGRQQVFNDAVVRAFQAQDRVNRELTAQILLTMLDLAWRDAAKTGALTSLHRLAISELPTL